MQFPTSIATMAMAIISLTSASTIPRAASQTQFSVQINVTQSDIHTTRPDYILDCNINGLCQAPADIVVSKLKVVPGSGTNGLQTDQVECRQFIAENQFDPLKGPASGAPFGSQREVYVSTNAVVLGPVVCVLKGAGETGC